MDWIELYGVDRQPTKADIGEFVASPLWEDLNTFLYANYEVEPSYSYSGCSGQPGWNVKYQKAGRSLCTLYEQHPICFQYAILSNKWGAVQPSMGRCLVLMGKEVPSP